jgi:hypothetical protein
MSGVSIVSAKVSIVASIVRLGGCLVKSITYDAASTVAIVSTLVGYRESGIRVAYYILCAWPPPRHRVG